MAFKGTFEEAVKRLDEVAGLLESGEQVLDDSIKLYEEGMMLIEFCNKKLNDVEKKVKKLSRKEGEVQAEDM